MIHTTIDAEVEGRKRLISSMNEDDRVELLSRISRTRKDSIRIVKGRGEKVSKVLIMQYINELWD